MTSPRRLLTLSMLGAVLSLAGCAADVEPGTAVGVGSAPSPTHSASPTPGLSPGTNATTPAGEPAGESTVGSVLVSAALGVTADEYPAPPAPRFAEVSGAAELTEVFGDVPGVDEVAAAVEADPPGAEQRLFVYVVGACRVDDLSLNVKGKQVTLVVAGTSTLRCVPPPMQMVVWTVDADDVPAGAMPAQAIQT